MKGKLRNELADKYVGHPFETNESTTITVARAAYRDGFKAAVLEVRSIFYAIQRAKDAMERSDHPAERDLRDIKLRE